MRDGQEPLAPLVRKVWRDALARSDQAWTLARRRKGEDKQYWTGKADAYTELEYLLQVALVKAGEKEGPDV